MAAVKPVATLVNRTDAAIVLPKFYLSKSDEDGEKNPQVVRLDAAKDRGVVGFSPEVQLLAYSFQRLRANRLVQAMVNRGVLEFRAPGLVLDIAEAA